MTFPFSNVCIFEACHITRFALAMPAGVPATTVEGFAESVVKQALHGGFTRVCTKDSTS